MIFAITQNRLGLLFIQQVEGKMEIAELCLPMWSAELPKMHSHAERGNEDTKDSHVERGNERRFKSMGHHRAT